MAIYAPINFRLYRDGVEIKRGQIFGSAKVQIPSDANDHNYKVAFIIPGDNSQTPGYVARRTVHASGLKK